MRIAIIGLNQISKFYAIILAVYGHEILIYETDTKNTVSSVKDIIIEKDFFNNFIKPLKIFKNFIYKETEIEVVEKFLIKENIKKEKFLIIDDIVYVDDFMFDKIPNLEVITLKTDSINQIKMMEDLLIIDTNNEILLNQLDLVKKNNWLSIKINSNEITNDFQITKEGKYSIFGIFNHEKMNIFINFKKESKKEILKIISKKFKNYKIENEFSIKKYNNYSYKNIAIINNALEEFNFGYRDYSLLMQIIQNTESKKVYSNLDIYSDIKSKVI